MQAKAVGLGGGHPQLTGFRRVAATIVIGIRVGVEVVRAIGDVAQREERR